MRSTCSDTASRRHAAAPMSIRTAEPGAGTGPTTALPSPFYLTGPSERFIPFISGRATVDFWIRFWFFAGMGGSLLLSLLATAVPLWLGFRAFRRFEF